MTSVKAFFRRPDWRGKVGSGQPPRWHRYVGHRETTTPNGIRRTTVVALCGYEFSVDKALAADGIGISSLNWRDDVKSAKLRCAKCDAAAKS